MKPEPSAGPAGLVDMALYRRKRIKDRRNGAPPPAFPRDGAYIPNPSFEGADKAPDPMPDAALNPERSTPDEANKKTQ